MACDGLLFYGRPLCRRPKSGQIGPVGSWDLLVDVEFERAVSGVGRCLIGLVAPWRFKMLDSQAVKSNMGPVPTNFYEICDF